MRVEDVVGQLRWQLGLERVALFAVRGAFAAGLLLVVLSVLPEGIPVVLATAPVFLAVAFGIWRWPSDLEAARAFDRRSHLEERLATATELAQRGRQGRFDLMQIGDAVLHAKQAPRVWLALNRRAATEAAAACVVVIVAGVCAVLIHNLPQPGAATSDEAPVAAAVANVPDELAQRALPLDVPDQAAALPTQAPAVATNLASRIQQEQAERSALDNLAQGLSNLSAGQPAADAIEEGNYGAARDQLQSLADNADQLSDAARQQLARGLQRAAAATGQSDKALADREQQAAQALTRSTYVDQRQALGALADQVQRSGARSVPADQLERDVGQLQQQQQRGSGAQNSGGKNAQGAAQNSGVQNGQGAAPQSSGQRAQSAGSGGGQDNQGGPGVGTGPNPDPFSNEPSRLDTSGQQVQVPLKLGNGPGVRPSDGTEDQAVPNPELSGRSVSELPQSQQTGQVVPEQNLVPGEQRPVVRGYFR